jgi:hypothetical protein
MSSIFKATHITSDKILAQPSAYGFGAIPITTGLNAFSDPSGFGHAWNLPQASSSQRAHGSTPLRHETST